MRKRAQLPQDSKLHCNALQCTPLHCIALYCLPAPRFQNALLQYTVILYTEVVIYCNALHCVALHCSAAPIFKTLLYCIENCIVFQTALHCRGLFALRISMQLGNGLGCPKILNCVAVTHSVAIYHCNVYLLQLQDFKLVH